MILHLVHPDEQHIEMTPQPDGYFIADIPNLSPATLYYYRPDDKDDYPDPASQFQPEGVHRPSKVVNHHSFSWTDHDWKGVPAEDLVLYELHVGTFTPEGTFEAIIPRLQELKELGINGIQLLPVGQFPGNRNWGYDGVYPYAVQDSYGGPQGLKKLVDAAHSTGVAVILDVVYNHFGPEGNYLEVFGPYFTDKYKTPWGKAINFDGAYSDPVREYFSDNVLYWIRYFHIDGLRFDAIHEIFDQGAVSFWELLHRKLSDESSLAGRKCWLIAESDLNAPRVILSPEVGGYGFDAQWLDDFHHALYTLLDKNGQKRYTDFGSIRQLQKAYETGFVHSGEFVNARQRKHGKSTAGISGRHFVVFNQNHDQTGNRVNGERLASLVDFERLKLAAGALLTAPYTPMLFMGEEYGEEAPFYYFVSHSDPELIKAVTKGRQDLFSALGDTLNGPDPHEIDTFNKCILQWEMGKSGKHSILRNWTKKLIQLRRTHPALTNLNKNDVWCSVAGPQGLAQYRRSRDEQHLLLILMNFAEEDAYFALPDHDKWGTLLDSSERHWRDDHDGKRAAPASSLSEKEIVIKPLQFIILERHSAESKAFSVQPPHH